MCQYYVPLEESATNLFLIMDFLKVPVLCTIVYHKNKKHLSYYLTFAQKWKVYSEMWQEALLNNHLYAFHLIVWWIFRKPVMMRLDFAVNWEKNYLFFSEPQ
jgi:hypothetical protein